MQRRLCPLSFPLVVQSRKLPSLIPGQDKIELKTGMPCIESRCEWWYEFSMSCIIFEILRQLPGPQKQE